MSCLMLNSSATACQARELNVVDVIGFCHCLTVKGKCHHEGDGDIGGAAKANGVMIPGQS